MDTKSEIEINKEPPESHIGYVDIDETSEFHNAIEIKEESLESYMDGIIYIDKTQESHYDIDIGDEPLDSYINEINNKDRTQESHYDIEIKEEPVDGISHKDRTPEPVDGISHKDRTPEPVDGISHKGRTPEPVDGISHKDRTPESHNDIDIKEELVGTYIDGINSKNKTQESQNDKIDWKETYAKDIIIKDKHQNQDIGDISIESKQLEVKEEINSYKQNDQLEFKVEISLKNNLALNTSTNSIKPHIVKCDFDNIQNSKFPIVLVEKLRDEDVALNSSTISSNQNIAECDFDSLRNSKFPIVLVEKLRHEDVMGHHCAKKKYYTQSLQENFKKCAQTANIKTDTDINDEATEAEDFFLTSGDSNNPLTDDSNDHLWDVSNNRLTNASSYQNKAFVERTADENLRADDSIYHQFEKRFLDKNDGETSSNIVDKGFSMSLCKYDHINNSSSKGEERYLQLSSSVRSSQSSSSKTEERYLQLSSSVRSSQSSSSKAEERYLQLSSSVLSIQSSSSKAEERYLQLSSSVRSSRSAYRKSPKVSKYDFGSLKKYVNVKKLHKCTMCTFITGTTVQLLHHFRSHNLKTPFEKTLKPSFKATSSNQLTDESHSDHEVLGEFIPVSSSFEEEDNPSLEQEDSLRVKTEEVSFEICQKESCL